ncbi:electron transport complex, RnfABCDGE type, B subunit/electron transport complex, RnfABCDGE type, C subunit/electron transport complex, RnfABCDGE type, G subunit [Salipiger thiooxidans]|uniref:Electron transport complex, RnfABCDGE type, B subunit/electron transport complex, RnfABCDGE type, C subunit/electron transport complex, RnfABCDGE type, G subunit n=1 Tax=Salipiger thiooxidans TaxID=282683 RepID=A0A1G7HP10_9RHOB|nr:RnfABCDGE type electron transport complex subunit C [Salipiger thiooxidans]SDF02180.1 electron transport complex, RnfABCDGE type, B subunit/electron transport complex, RnfABCDGE type, C subunit/electron transport complex, RnfABCDGE type, G subunit [Salipiger thiooxidans]
MIAAAASMSALGLGLGLLLGAAAKKFHVETPPVIDEMKMTLPGTNCGQCGYPGCRGAAEAIAGGTTLCPPGGRDVALQQYIGAPAEPLVSRDDRVLKGQLIARSRGPISANPHAPTSGTVIAVGHFPAPHPSGLPVPTITIRADGKDEWAPRLPRLRPEDADPAEIAARVAEAGIVGIGGATFPTAVKLNLRDRYALHTLIINAAECEPYLTCDDRLLRESAEEVADGAGIMARALGVDRIIVAIESNKPEAAAAMRRHNIGMGYPLEVRMVPAQYPMHAAHRHLHPPPHIRPQPLGQAAVAGRDAMSAAPHTPRQPLAARLKGAAANPGVLLAAFSLATALILAGSDELTSGAIATRATEDLYASLSQVEPDGLHDNDLTTDTRVIADAEEGEVPVYLVTAGGTPTAVAFGLTGYGGPIRVLIGIAPDGMLLGVRVLSHAETPGLGDKIEPAKSDWIEGFTGHSLTDPSP